MIVLIEPEAEPVEEKAFLCNEFLKEGLCLKGI